MADENEVRMLSRGRQGEGEPGEDGTPEYAVPVLRTVDELVISRDSVRPRPLAEWTECDGPVNWWRFPVDEPPYVGTPLDRGAELVVSLPTMGHAVAVAPNEARPKTWQPRKIRYPGASFFFGGWPGYHTHWTPIIVPLPPQSGQMPLPFAAEVA